MFWLLALVLVPVSLLFGLSMYLQPLYGDLTRIGSYAENDFGWNKPQLEFKQPLSKFGQYEHYYDVLVLGDSFSTARPRQNWQNYLVAATGWSMVTLDINEINLAQVLNSPVFRKTPPRFLILETVERELSRRMKHEESCSARASLNPAPVAARSSPNSVTIPERDLRDLTRHVNREIAWQDVKLGYVRDYLWKSTLRTLNVNARGKAVKVELASDAPFSSSIRDAMLVYKNDIRKAQWWGEMGLSGISCRIERMRKQAEANGQTRFVLMVAPDKLTAYADHLRDKDLRRLSALPELSSNHPDIMPRLDIALISAIREGEQDVYLPDDTHWGSTGDKIAAETLLAFLQQPSSGSF